ncbi:MAG: 2-C-methyl-D-erythritol 4-phosphate cytidylyltransferase [Nitriliruptorales bacterium]
MSDTPRTAAVVVAAGVGERLAGGSDGTPKALVEVAGRTLLELALTSLRAVPAVTEVVVVHPPGEEEAFRAIAGDTAVLVPGGATRTESVAAGVAALSPDVEVVAVHDAARPLVPPAVVARAIDAVRGDVVAAAPGLAVADTLKRVGPDGDVVETVDRSDLWAVHTPQVVRRDILVDALAGRRADATDDLALVERLREAGAVGGRIVLVRGDPRDVKVTCPEDLVLVASVVEGTRVLGA